MLETSLAQSGYANSVKSTGSGRALEYQIFARVTKALTDLEPSALDYPARMAEALHRNLKLWTVLAVDVADDNNELPAALRSNLFYLSEFTRHHTAKIHAGAADPKILIEINTMVMRGLRGETGLEGDPS